MTERYGFCACQRYSARSNQEDALRPPYRAEAGTLRSPAYNLVKYCLTGPRVMLQPHMDRRFISARISPRKRRHPVSLPLFAILQFSSHTLITVLGLLAMAFSPVP